MVRVNCGQVRPLKVGLINSNRRGLRNGVPPVPPLGLDYLVDDLEADEHTVSLLDLCFLHDSEVKDAVQTFVRDQDVVGVTFRNLGVDCYWLPEEQFFLPYLRSLVEMIRPASSAPIVLGGQGFSIYPEQILKFVDADFGIAGPGEVAFRQLLRHINEHHRQTVLRGVPNLSIVHKRQLIDYQPYTKNGGCPAIQTKSGCPMPCSYCVESRKKLYRREMTSLLEEVDIISRLGVPFVFFAEAEFNNQLHHAEAVCDALIERHIPFQWSTYLNPVPATESLIKKLTLAGCSVPCISVVSGDDSVLGAFDTRFGSSHVRQMAEWCHKYDLQFSVDLLFGGPGETIATATRTLDLMEEINPQIVGMNVGVRIYRNTTFGRNFMAGKYPVDGCVYGHTQRNNDLFWPIFYISDLSLFDMLRERCVGNSQYRLLGHREFGGVNYTQAA